VGRIKEATISQLKSTVPKQKITAAERQKEIEALAANPKEPGIANPEGERASRDESPCSAHARASQRSIPPGKRSGLLTRIAAMESVSLCVRMKS
jgi:hypothetical protein